MNIHDDPEDIEYRTTMKLHRRAISDEQFDRFEGYAAEISAAFGLDLNTPATNDTADCRYIRYHAQPGQVDR